jgi:aminoglycoside 6'-N-acetyltransferase I
VADIYVEERGTGEPLVLLHGMTGTSGDWRHVFDLDKLARSFRVGLRSHADGCDGRHRVGFIEGWFVEPEHRGNGMGRALMQAAGAWARSHGCREMASDTWIDNDPSQRAHEALGFEVVDRCVHFRKALR